MRTKRIKWVDVAKGLCIFLVLVGHVTKYKLMKTFIYSFHMPLFFLLSGFTLKVPDNISEFKIMLINDAKRLLLPLVVMQSLFITYLIAFQNINLNSGMEYFLKSLIWGGTTFNEHKFSVGMLWFLVALFWAKQIVRIVEYNFSNNNWVIYILLTYIGINLPPKYVLPQCLDIALVCALYIYLGYIGKKYYSKIDNYWEYMTVFASIVWLMTLDYVGYINISGRWYSKTPYSIIMTVAASICIIKLSQLLSEKERLYKIFSWCGINSMIIFCCQSLDLSTHLFWTTNFAKSILLRSFICIGGAYVILRLKSLLNKYINQFTRKNIF